MAKGRQQTICRNCGCYRDRKIVDEGWDEDNRICQVCKEEARIAKAERLDPHFGRRLKALVDLGNADVTTVAMWVRKMSDAIGGIENATTVILEFLYQVPSVKLRAAKVQNYIQANKALAMSALLVSLTALNDAERKEKQSTIAMKKSLHELSDDQLKENLLDVALPIIQKNPQLAVLALEQAGYRVTLTKVK